MPFTQHPASLASPPHRYDWPTRDCPLRLSYLTANSAFAFTFGDALLRLEDRSGPFPLFFSSQQDATSAARACGLSVSPSGRVHGAL